MGVLYSGHHAIDTKPRPIRIDLFSEAKSLTSGEAPLRLRRFILSVCLYFLFVASSHAQSPYGTISGIVIDPTGAPIGGAEVLIVNDATRVQYPGRTNDEGIYLIANLPPGSYRLQVSKPSFKTIIKPDITLNVQDALALNFTLPLGASPRRMDSVPAWPTSDTTQPTSGEIAGTPTR